LIDLFPDRVREVSEVQWIRAAGRVEAVGALMCGQIAIQESRGAPDPEAAADLLAEKGVEAGLARSEELDAFLERVRFAARYAPMPELSASSALRALAAGLRSLAELESAAREGGLERTLASQFPPQSRRLLDEIAPDRIRLSGGRQVRVHYEPGQPPWIASRLQDFFGMPKTPAVARGAVPVVVRLLAPNNRPVQMTTDLAGFWQRLYPQLRKELGRRYPKHRWPENPL
jgi:ATP-dependent RNA helicase HrpB